jgi:hypothetical protein
MKKFARKGILLFAAVLVVCAFATSMASAASWAVIGTTHQLFSNNLSFTIESPLNIGSSCANSEFDADVASASTLEITGGRFLNCRGTNLAAGCTVTATGTRFPWTATAPTTTNIQIHGIHVDVRFEQPPENPNGCSFLVVGQDVTLTGTLTGGSFDPSSIGANRRVTFNNASGTVAHSSALGSNGALVNGTITDTTATLNLFD